MQIIDQVVCRWTYPAGLAGGPGYNIFYGPNLSTKISILQTLYESLRPYIPLNMSCAVLGNGIKVQDSDGIQVGDWALTAPAPSVGTAATTGVSPSSGCTIDWRTTGRNWRGHKIAGKSYMVPLAGSAFTSSGVLQPAAVTAILAGAQSMLNSMGSAFGVWSRPVYGPKDDVTGERPVLHPGLWTQCTSTNVPTKIVVLRSRRD